MAQTPSRAPYSYRKEKEPHELIFRWLLFLSLEALLLVSIKNCNHWSGPIFWTYTEHYFFSYSQSIRFVRLDSEHEQSDRKSVNCGLPVLDLPSSCDSWCWPKGARPLGTRMMIIMASSIACGYVCTMTVMAATTELCKMVGHSLDNRLTETCSLGIQPTALILDIHVMVNWHLSKDICWPVSHDHIPGSN